MRSLLLIVCCLVVVACSRTPIGFDEKTVAQHMLSADDLPGFQMTSDKALSYDIPEIVTRNNANGLLFRHFRDFSNGTTEVQHIIEAYADENGAHKELEYRKEYFNRTVSPTIHVLNVGTFGDESVAVAIDAGTEKQYFVYYRSGRYVGNIAIFNPTQEPVGELTVLMDSAMRRLS